MITSLTKIYFRKLILSIHTIKVISTKYGNRTSWKLWRWELFDLILLMRGIYIKFNLNTQTKFTSSRRSTMFKEGLSIDHEDHPNKHQNSDEICNETGHLILRLWGSHWKLRQQNDKNFPMQGNPLYNKY